jgi:NAD(P)-dependent dehydrogenase (short-subunit alcohol dehydrogenase family)
MTNVLITGANRGIGLEFVVQFLEKGFNVIATCRKPGDAKELKELLKQNKTRLFVLAMDVSDDSSIKKACTEITKKYEHLDYIVNNAGIMQDDKFGKLKSLDLLAIFKTNAIAPMIISQEFYPLVKKAKNPVIVGISSRMGSIQLKDYPGSYGYSASKAALNMFFKIMAYELMKEKIVSIVISPGWVQTSMGGAKATHTAHEAVSGIIQKLVTITMPDTGKFFQWDGRELPW